MHSPRIRLSSIIAALVCANLVQLGLCAVVTIYLVDKPLDPQLPSLSVIPESESPVKETNIISPIGTGTDGATSYEWQNIVSLIVQQNVTVLSQPVTWLYTMVQGTSTYELNGGALATGSPDPTGILLSEVIIAEECSFNKDNESGTCVQVQKSPLFAGNPAGASGPAMTAVITTGTTTMTTTFTGTLLPIATITVSAASKRVRFGFVHAAGWGMVLGLLLGIGFTGWL